MAPYPPLQLVTMPPKISEALIKLPPSTMVVCTTPILYDLMTTGLLLITACIAITSLRDWSTGSLDSDNFDYCIRKSGSSFVRTHHNGRSESQVSHQPQSHKGSKPDPSGSQVSFPKPMRYMNYCHCCRHRFEAEILDLDVTQEYDCGLCIKTGALWITLPEPVQVPQRFRHFDCLQDPRCHVQGAYTRTM